MTEFYALWDALPTGEKANWVSAIGTWTGMIFTVLALFLAGYQLRRQANTARAESFSRIAHEWTAMYKARNDVISGQVVITDSRGERHVHKLKTLDELEELYPTYDLFFKNCVEWPEIRQLCNFFEKLGVAVHQRFLEPQFLFILVTVDTKSADPLNPDGPGAIELHLAPYIQYLRGGKPGKKSRRIAYRKDIYVFYDYLLNEWRHQRHHPMRPYRAWSRRYRFNPPR
ncbi:MAG: hypothetical protein ABL901_05285 [Hyphomicrobiaceae bacterium]